VFQVLTVFPQLGVAVGKAAQHFVEAFNQQFDLAIAAFYLASV